MAAFVHYKMCKVQGERDVGEDVHLAEPGLENLFMRALGYWTLVRKAASDSDSNSDSASDGSDIDHD